MQMGLGVITHEEDIQVVQFDASKTKKSKFVIRYLSTEMKKEVGLYLGREGSLLEGLIPKHDSLAGVFFHCRAAFWTWFVFHIPGNKINRSAMFAFFALANFVGPPGANVKVFIGIQILNRLASLANKCVSPRSY